MTARPERPWLPPAPDETSGLLERAVGYARGSLALVTPERLGAPTPCDAWDLRALLDHMDDALAAFTEAADLGRVSLAPPMPTSGLPVVDSLRGRACALLAAWSAPGRGVPSRSGPGGREPVADAGAPVTVGDRAAAAPVLALAGALEITVHGWDVAQACGGGRPVPSDLALTLLAAVDLLVLPEDRPTRFAPPLPLASAAGPEERLLTALGRRPRNLG